MKHVTTNQQEAMKVQLSKITLLHVLTDGVVTELKRITEIDRNLSIAKVAAGQIILQRGELDFQATDRTLGQLIVSTLDGKMTVEVATGKDEAHVKWLNETIALLGE